MVDVLASRTIIAPTSFATSRRFYEHTLGLAVFREFSNADQVVGVVFDLGGGHLELSSSGSAARGGVTLWLQVADLQATFAEVSERGAPVSQAFGPRPWGLLEAWVSDPDGNQVALVEAPPGHPLHPAR